MNHLELYFSVEEIKILKNTKNLYDKAYFMVSRIFKNVQDKGGNPYILHLIEVSKNVSTKKAKVVGLLHDILEDTPISEEDLFYLEFPKEIVTAISIVTRRKNESYEEFINRIILSNNVLALKVKRADMENNMDLSRIPSVTEKDKDRVIYKYLPNYQKIIRKMEEKKR